MGQMYKVFVNQRTIYLAGNIGQNSIYADEQTLMCNNREQLENAVSKFLSESAPPSIYLINSGTPEELFGLFSSVFLFIDAAGGLVKDPSGRLLFIHRLGSWDLPKGKIEKGEDAFIAAIREVTEETGLKSLKIIKALPCTYHIFERKGKLRLKRTFWFEMESSNDGPLYPQLDEDITEARWYEQNELAEPLSNTYPAIRELVEGYLSE
jgi:8-oxo-dGTP pyrophosphatase MutT (NUDIX family)